MLTLLQNMNKKTTAYIIGQHAFKNYQGEINTNFAFYWPIS